MLLPAPMLMPCAQSSDSNAFANGISGVVLFLRTLSFRRKWRSDSSWIGLGVIHARPGGNEVPGRFGSSGDAVLEASHGVTSPNEGIYTPL